MYNILIQAKLCFGDTRIMILNLNPPNYVPKEQLRKWILV